MALSIDGAMTTDSCRMIADRRRYLAKPLPREDTVRLGLAKYRLGHHLPREARVRRQHYLLAAHVDEVAKSVAVQAVAEQPVPRRLVQLGSGYGVHTYMRLSRVSGADL